MNTKTPLDRLMSRLQDEAALTSKTEVTVTLTREEVALVASAQAVQSARIAALEEALREIVEQVADSDGIYGAATTLCLETEGVNNRVANRVLNGLDSVLAEARAILNKEGR